MPVDSTTSLRDVTIDIFVGFDVLVLFVLLVLLVVALDHILDVVDKVILATRWFTMSMFLIIPAH